MSSEVQTWFPPLGPKGAALVNDPRRYILVHGPRKGSKTISICIKVANHLYSNDGAVVGIIVKRKTSGKIGVWEDITGAVIEGMYQRNGGVLPWRRRPAVTENKTCTFSVQNGVFRPLTQDWGVSHCHLIACYSESEIYEIMKNTRFSMIYVCEADQFETSTIFNACADQLRSLTVPEDRFQLILDCNPAEEGDLHWLHGLFLEEPVDPEERAKFDAKYANYKFLFEDNPFLAKSEKDDLIQRYSRDPVMAARFLRGEWVRSTTGSLFEDHFSRQRHIVGDADLRKPRSEWTCLLPARGTRELFGGWDLGDTSHAAVICSKRFVRNNLVAFDQLDELISIDQQIPLSILVEQFVEKMDKWERYLRKVEGQDVKIMWRHWSDITAFTYKAAAENNEAKLVKEYSDGRISLTRVAGRKKNVDVRIGMMKRMYKEDLLRHSSTCLQTIAMVEHLKERALRTGRTDKDLRRWTHAFDALTFLIMHEVPLAYLNREQEPERGVLTVA